MGLNLNAASNMTAFNSATKENELRQNAEMSRHIIIST
jgi:hypothetical protein